MRFHQQSIRPMFVVLALILGPLLLTVVSVSAETCCACGHSCSGDVADFAACYYLCQGQGDFFVNFHDNTGCSSIKACDQGACCDRKPECKEMTRLGCAIDAAGKGFLAGKTCADCPSKKPLKQIMVVATELIQADDGSLQARSYYVIIEIARLTKDSGYKGYVIKVPRTVVPDEHGDVPPEQLGDVQAGRVTRKELSDDQWEQLKGILDGLGLNAEPSLDDIFEDLEPEEVASINPVEMANVSAPEEIPDPANPEAEYLKFSHWEIQRRATEEIDEGLWYLHTVVGSSREISIGTNDPASGIGLEAFMVNKHCLPRDYEGDLYLDGALLILPNIDDLMPDAAPGGTLFLTYEEEDNCSDAHWELDGDRVADGPRIDVMVGDNVQLTLVCSADYASIIPEETRDCARHLAWHSGYRHITHFDERWSVRETAPREMCDTCGTPMCIVCMEYDLGTYHTRPGVTSSQRSCLRTVEWYLRTVTREKTEVLAAVYWEAYWDGRHNRNRP